MANHQWALSPDKRELNEEVQRLSSLAIRYRRLYRHNECTLFQLLENSNQLRKLKIRLRQLEQPQEK